MIDDTNAGRKWHCAGRLKCSLDDIPTIRLGFFLILDHLRNTLRISSTLPKKIAEVEHRPLEDPFSLTGGAIHFQLNLTI